MVSRSECGGILTPSGLPHELHPQIDPPPRGDMILDHTEGSVESPMDSASQTSSHVLRRSRTPAHDHSRRWTASSATTQRGFPLTRSLLPLKGDFYFFPRHLPNMVVRHIKFAAAERPLFRITLSNHGELMANIAHCEMCLASLHRDCRVRSLRL